MNLVVLNCALCPEVIEDLLGDSLALQLNRNQVQLVLCRQHKVPALEETNTLLIFQVLLDFPTLMDWQQFRLVRVPSIRVQGLLEVHLDLWVLE